MVQASLSFASLALGIFHSSYVFALPSLASRDAARLSPPPGCSVVRASGAQTGEFSTIQAAVDAVPKKVASACIFVYGGKYAGGVSIKVSVPLTIYGETAKFVETSLHIDFADLTDRYEATEPTTATLSLSPTT
jgi:pectinesterase